ncbi:phosphatase PAP2 family protein [Kitasatospora sp. NPDC096077]|uniref:phosphatase PAP2 family protein n=1 Tax=Kitasatospora sp. NPDC096077 TaxID=3155544 RepID=UPI0033244224
MSAPLRGWLGVVAALAALVVLGLAVRYAGASEPGRLDDRIGTALYGVGSPWHEVARTLDALGEPAGSGALMTGIVVACLAARRVRAAVFAVAGVGLAVGAATLLKHLVGRTIHGDNLSYPSGHTAFATALALVVALLATRGRGREGLGPVLGAALLAGAAMGWAQIALGAHYPTDVLGGWCTALAVVPATGRLVDRFFDTVQRKQSN